ncbi:MAG: 2-C-methyl-D-erythritol 2,4-cyclodiphosphate synthase [Candidatus Cloacimonetes bacterium]|nr:2-C-methyl-D-erythritol 2,4-cyclodiphosphate synthase [Candidatus Cloacimonadota bacterium]
MRIGHGYDVHQLVKGRKLFLGGIDIKFNKGLLGHSDADVLIHAVIDSVLGALAKGDIGQHFPDTDDKFKNISSRILLQKVFRMMQTADFQIGNVDVTVCCQEPKLQSYIMRMRRNLASDLKTDIANISIKATTEEELGVTGEGKGISATSVVLLKKT